MYIVIEKTKYHQDMEIIRSRQYTPENAPQNNQEANGAPYIHANMPIHRTKISRFGEI